MANFILIIKAIFSGIILGFGISIPLGPAGFEAVKRTMSMGFKEGMMVSFGAIASDTLDIVLINFGLFSLLDSNKKMEALFWVICGILISVMGYISINKAKHKDDVTDDLMEKKVIRTSPFFAGFLIAFSNPMAHSLWLTLSGTVIRVWQDRGNGAYYTFIFSIVFGMIIWFTILNYLALKGHKSMEAKYSKLISIVLAWSIFGLGIIFIVYGLAKFLLLSM